MNAVPVAIPFAPVAVRARAVFARPTGGAFNSCPWLDSLASAIYLVRRKIALPKDSDKEQEDLRKNPLSRAIILR